MCENGFYDLGKGFNAYETKNKWDDVLIKYGIRGFVNDDIYNADRSRLQARFLDEKFLKKLMMHLYPENNIRRDIEYANKKLAKKLDCKVLPLEMANPYLYDMENISVDFEDLDNMYDVNVGYCLKFDTDGYVVPDSKDYKFILRPVINDSYPVLIQQMSAVERVLPNAADYVVIYEKFEAEGITEQRFREIVKNVYDLNIKIVSVKEIEAVKLD